VRGIKQLKWTSFVENRVEPSLTANSRKGPPLTVTAFCFQAIVYGIDDLMANLGWVSVGMEQDTAEVAVETIRPIDADGLSCSTYTDGPFVPVKKLDTAILKMKVFQRLKQERYPLGLERWV